MLAFLYNTVIWLGYHLGKLVRPFRSDVHRWYADRADWQQRLVGVNPENKPIFWMHASSLGEFEQGRPVLEQFRAEHPDWFIVLSFWSPSGYQVRKDYPTANFVCYMPSDLYSDAQIFLEAIRPKIAVFVKYEFWYNHLTLLKERGTSVLLLSAVFRADQPFFLWYGSLWRRMLPCFEAITVQDAASAKLLHSIGAEQALVVGDTRIDRALELAGKARSQPLLGVFGKCFENGKQTIVAGSIWKSDAEILKKYIGHPDFNWIIAPHRIDESLFAWLEQRTSVHTLVRLSAVLEGTAKPISGNKPLMLLVDTIGHLNKLYAYADWAYIGGGFGVGIHNTLEPAAFGVPVVFGPKYMGFNEAKALREVGAAFAVGDQTELHTVFEQLKHNNFRTQAGHKTLQYMYEHAGATAAVMEILQSWVLKSVP